MSNGIDKRIGSPGTPGLIWRNDWELEVNYMVNDAVYYDGSSYRATVEHTSESDNCPGEGEIWTDVWKILARGLKESEL